jgi:hypothetical protein
MVTEMIDHVAGKPESRAFARARTGAKTGPLVVVTGAEAVSAGPPPEPSPQRARKWLFAI